MASSGRTALIALYRSAGGANWTRRDNWDTDADLSEWYGVKVDDLGRVKTLDLDGNNLQGT